MAARALPDEQGSGKTGTGGAGGDAAPPPSSLVERLRDVHLQMVDAVLAGDGLGRVAELAAEAAGGPVAIIVPRIGGAAAPAARGTGAQSPPAPKRCLSHRVRGPPRQVPHTAA